jgi:hypothetical protein
MRRHLQASGVAALSAVTLLTLAVVPASAAPGPTKYNVANAVNGDGCYTQLDAYWDGGTAYVRAEFKATGSATCEGYLIRQENGADSAVSDHYTVSPGQTAITGWHWDGGNNGVLSYSTIWSVNGGAAQVFTPSW